MNKFVDSAQRMLNALLRPLGLRLTQAWSPAERRRRVLLSRLHIDCVIDIGANRGQYARSLRTLGYRGRIISYEPLPDAFAKLNAATSVDHSWQAHNAAVSNQPGPLTIHVSANSESSSALAITDRHLDACPEAAVVGQVQVQTIPLSEILARAASTSIFLKIDTQGYEMPILLSGQDHLRSVSLIEIEMSLVPVYEGQALFHDVDKFLRETGFELISLDDAFFDERTGQLLQLDGIYAIRETSVG